jgi:hypothetical protein
MLAFNPSSRELLKGVLDPHKELALDLLKMVKSLDTSDSSHRFQIASVTIFLAGIDKTLSLAFELLYLAGKVDWNWMVPNSKFQPPVGFIECQRGLTAKIMKLKKLGVNVPYLQGIIDLRNEYVHSCHIYLGYTLGFDDVECKIQLKPTTPIISFPLSPMTAFRSKEIYFFTEQIIDEISSYIDSVDWQSGWFKLTQKIECLPQNPEPDYSQILNEPERESEILDALNKRFIGEGARLLRE